MAVLIKGMQMPETCVCCKMKYFDPEVKSANPMPPDEMGTFVCLFTDEEIWNIKRGDQCPLTEVPETHGDLIDRDYLKKIIGGFHLNWEYGDGVSDCWNAIMTAPTVIPASEVEDG